MARSTDTPPRICAVLLAAGAARRYGSPKQLVEIDGVPLVRRSAQAALDAGLELLVVTGAYAPQVCSALDGLDAPQLHNPDWAEGMGRSIAVAFTHLLARERHEHALICLVDQPLVDAAQLQRLLSVHLRAPGGITAANHGVALGPPCAFARSYFRELAALAGPQGARALIEHHAGALATVDMPEAAIDLDTPEDHAALLGTQRS